MSDKTRTEVTEHEQVTRQWLEFSKTLAYRQFIEHIELQKQTYNTLAGGPVEVYRDVHTFEGKKDIQLDFEPQKYAYLLQRGVGCDIVKMFVEGYTYVPAK